MNKICLINPPYIGKQNLDSQKHKYYQTGYTIPHLGLGYIASVLEDNRYDVDLFECMGQRIDVDEIIDIINSNNYSMIGISVYDNNLKNAYRIIKGINKINHPFIFIGGYCATFNYDQILLSLPQIDCCVIGEGEITTLELANAINCGNSWKSTKGIAYNSVQGIIKTDKCEIIENLDELPIPKRAFFSNSGMATISSSRGCANNCCYCAVSNFYNLCSNKKIRFRSAKSIIEEINYLINTYPNIKEITFLDENILLRSNSNIARLSEFIQIMKKNDLFIPFRITACAKDIVSSFSMLKNLKEVGLRHVFVGIESFIQRQLDYYRKNTTVLENIKAIEILSDLSLTADIALIPYDQNSTLSEINEFYNTLSITSYLSLATSYSDYHSRINIMIACNGTPIKDNLIKANEYINNEYGYRFKNESIYLLHKILRNWHVHIDSIAEKMYLIDFCLEIGRIEDYNKLMNIKRKIIHLDVEYVKFITNLLIDGIQVDKIYSIYSDSWFKRLLSYKNEFLSVEMMVDNYEI